MLQIGLTDVEQALAGDGGVFDPLVFGDEGQTGVLKGGFTGRRRGLHQDGQGRGELPGEAGQIPHQPVDRLAD